jgi:hypothetical protein
MAIFGRASSQILPSKFAKSSKKVRKKFAKISSRGTNKFAKLIEIVYYFW